MGLHVVPSDMRWSIRKSGGKKSIKTYATKSEAVNDAKDMLVNRIASGALYVHGPDGRIAERLGLINETP